MTQTPLLTPEALAMLGTPSLVYVRSVPALQLKQDGVIPADAPVDDAQTLYSIHAANGQRVAILDSRESAFFAARQQKMEPVSVH